MALDSVYTNLIGLALLVIAAPVLIATAAVVSLYSHGDSPLERIECPGFSRSLFKCCAFARTIVMARRRESARRFPRCAW